MGLPSTSMLPKVALSVFRRVTLFKRYPLLPQADFLQDNLSLCLLEVTGFGKEEFYVQLLKIVRNSDFSQVLVLGSAHPCGGTLLASWGSG